MKLTTSTIKLISTITFTVLSVISFGQDQDNLVTNPSFESVRKSPKRLGSIENATGWSSPTAVKADLFTDGKEPKIATPVNVYGKEDPRQGENYVGITAYSKDKKINRSYVMSRLDAPLKKGMRYCVKFNVSLAEASKYAVNNIGAKLSKKPFENDEKVSLFTDPTLLHFDNYQKIMTARYNWTEICGVVQAEGGEKYITLGNFLSKDKTKIVRMKPDPKLKVPVFAFAYYYLDDVSVKLLNKEESCDCQADQGGNEYSTTIYQKAVNLDEDVTAEDKIEAQETFFAFGKSKLTSDGKSSLNMIAGVLEENPSFKLQINGHNNIMEDNVGAENDYYADMDNKRIRVVMKYLMEKGIQEGRLIAAQKGSSEPNKETQEEDSDDLKMAKNRHITFVIRQ
ncbi:MAG: OmpA family protein [Crocinitomicaceae bacterium]